MYRYLEIEPGSTLPAGCDLYEKAISLSGLSKSYGLPGLRIGWIATKDMDLLQQTAVLKDYTTICSSAPSEVLALIAVRARQTILEQQLKRVRANLTHLDGFFERNRAHFIPNRPLGGSICFPRMPGVPDTDQFCRQLVERTGIMLVPSRMFQYGDQHVRIGFGRQDLPDVLARFERYLATLSG
jgi:aspartate/methionine/tyrosine aminotransferase